MAVLVEAISLIIRRDAIERSYPGGWDAFANPYRASGVFCYDSEIARTGFMNPLDVTDYGKHLQAKGLVFRDENGAAVDFVVIDQLTGPTTPCPWIEVIRCQVPGGIVSAARLKGSKVDKLSLPSAWNFDKSMSKNFVFIPTAKQETK